VASINRVVIVGNLTRDPDVRALPSGTSVVELGVAVNHRYKNRQTDQWVEEPNYFNVVVFGAQGQACANYLTKGRPVAVDGRLRWSSWEDKNGGGKRSKVDIVADTVQFLGSREDGGGQGGGAQGGGGQAQDQGNQGFGASDVPADTSDFGDPVPAGGGGGGNDDDIPF
jgi:single-strand DNA-binding protein